MGSINSTLILDTLSTHSVLFDTVVYSCETVMIYNPVSPRIGQVLFWFWFLSSFFSLISSRAVLPAIVTTDSFFINVKPEL